MVQYAVQIVSCCTCRKFPPFVGRTVLELCLASLGELVHIKRVNEDRKKGREGSTRILRPFM